jgi:hypothetical protein
MEESKCFICWEIVVNGVACPDCSLKACADCIKTAGSACTVCKTGNFPPTYTNDEGGVVIIDYAVPEAMEDDEAHELYVTESESSATIDSDTTDDSESDDDDTGDDDTEDDDTEDDDAMQDDDHGATRMDMCYLLSQLEDLKDVVSLLRNPYLERMVRDAKSTAIRIMLNL